MVQTHKISGRHVDKKDTDCSSMRRKERRLTQSLQNEVYEDIEIGKTQKKEGISYKTQTHSLAILVQNY